VETGILNAHLVAALRQYFAEIEKILDEQETSVTSEDTTVGPLRGEPIYLAAQEIERCLQNKMPDEWDSWRELLFITDEDRPLELSKRQIHAAYVLLKKLRRWATERLDSETRESKPQPVGVVAVPANSDLEALRTALDALNRLHVAINLINTHLDSLQRQVNGWGWVLHFDRPSGKFLGVSKNSSPDDIEFPADNIHCIEIASHCEWLPKYVESHWEAHAAADKALSELPTRIKERLDALVGKPWFATARRDCLDKILKWPGEVHHQSSMAAEKTYGSVIELLEKANKNKPYATWKEYSPYGMMYRTARLSALTTGWRGLGDWSLLTFGRYRRPSLVTVNCEAGL
jgi:hypothetical protein